MSESDEWRGESLAIDVGQSAPGTFNAWRTCLALLGTRAETGEADVELHHALIAAELRMAGDAGLGLQQLSHFLWAISSFAPVLAEQAYQHGRIAALLEGEDSPETLPLADLMTTMGAVLPEVEKTIQRGRG